jgi:DNA-binding MarR family transcriptional regulator
MEVLSKWYGVMPNKVLYDNELSATQKLIYVVISSLCAEKWYCRASNKYIWDQLNVSVDTASEAINKLVDKWYLYSKIDKKDWNKRYLTLSEKFRIPIGKNSDTYTKKPEDINTIYNIIYIASYDDIKEIVQDYNYRLENKVLLKCLMKLIEWWYKLEKKESEVKKFVDRIKEKAEIYNYKLVNWWIAEWELLQVFDSWYEYHKGKWDVSNYLNSVLTFIRNNKQPHFKKK